jgi:hypothetical protein
MSSLILHRGARLATLDQVAAVPTPASTETWYPIPHLAVLESVEETLDATGFAVRSKQLGLSANEQQFFATLELVSTLADGVALAVGIRNSIDKSLPLGFCAGSRVFVCDNLSFRAELMVSRKHTLNGSIRFREAIAHATGRLDSFRRLEAERIATMHTLLLDDREAESLILRAWERKIISHLQLPAIVSEWRKPSHEEFSPRTRWSLFNAFTEVLRPFSVSNPQNFAHRTMELNTLLLPPGEGPATLDAVFAVTGQERATLEAEDTALLALPAPVAVPVDDFWSSYEAGL